jgi:PAS domain S-box-containing protein
MDPQFNFIKVNRAYALADEMEPSFFPGKNHFDLYPNEENEAIFRRVVETAESYFADAKPFEYAEHPERGVSYWDWSLIPIKNQNNGVTGLVLSIINVTKRKLAEKALRESVERYRALFEEARDAIILADTETALIVDCNRAASEMLERNKSELIGQHQRIIHPPSSVKDGFSVSYKKHLEESEGQVLEEQVVTGSGKIKDVAIKANLLYLGERKLIQGIFRDITEKKLDQEALKESEEKFRSLAEQSPNMIFINRKGKVVYANKKCEEKMGYKREEFYSPDFDFLTLVAPESVDLVRDIIKRRSKGEDIKPYEYTLITKTGKRIESINSSKLVQYEGQKAILGVVTDITERKKAEEALRESENSYRAVVENATEGIIVVQDQTLQFVNPAIVSMMGYPEKELLTRPFTEFIHPDHKEWVMGIHIKRLKGEEAPPFYELKVLGKKGDVKWLENSGISIEWRGKPATLNFLRDITERKEAEQAIWESESEKKSILNAISDHLLFHDTELTIRWCNEAAARSVGMAQRELVGCHCYELWHGRSEPCERCPVLRAIETGLHTEGIITTPDGRWWEIIGEPVCDRDGKINGAIETARDITQRKKAEEELRIKDNAIASSINAIAIAEFRGDLTYINEAFLRMWGYDDENEVLGRPTVEFWQNEEKAQEIIELLRRRESVIGELVARRKDGSLFDVQLLAGVVTDETGAPVCMMGSFIDITERKKAEEALRESENRYKAVVDNAIEGIVVVQDGMLKFVNPKLISLVGYSVKESMSRPFIEFIHSDDRERVMGIHIKRLKGEEVPRINEFKVIDKKGNTIWMENNGILIEWSGRPASLNFLRDITERKKVQEALKYRIEFERLITMLSKRFIDPGDIDEKINQALKAIGEFAKVDRAYIFQLRDDNRTVDNTHEWRAEGIEPQIENLKGITLDDELPWFWEKMKAHETFHVPVVADLPPEAHLEKKHFERQGIQALVVVPMINKGVLKGFLGFDSVRSQKTWAEDIITLLIISGENISMALEREHAEQRARLLSSTVEQSSEGMGVIDLQGNLLFLNNAFAAMHGYTPEELIGRHVSVFHTPEQVPSVEAANRQTKETGEFNGEIWHVRLDGEVFPGLMHNSLLRNEKGEPVGMIGTLRDITESKRAEQALKESEMKFRSLTEDSLVGVYLIQDGVFKYVNPKFAETFGYTPDELIDTKGPDKIIFSEDWPTSKENLRRRLEGELKSIQYGFRGVTKDKKIIYVEVYGSATQYQGRPAVIGTLLDITERRRADEALQESELKFKTIFENAGGAIFIADRKTGEILECNTQAEMLLGCTRAEIIGMHQSEIHPWGEEEKYKKRFAAHVQKGHAVDYEGEVQHRDGRRIPVWITAQSLKIGGKDVILGLLMNITERKKAEEKLIENRAKLKSLASQLSLIEERERHRLATELHDQISQSLVMSKMKLDSLRYSTSSSESAEVLEEVSDYLGQIIQDTRTLTFDLSSPILYELGFEAAVAEWLDEQIREKHGIKTEFEDDGQPKPLDDDILVLLFRNVRELLINVVKHANAKNVKVSIWKMDKNICVRVEDDGVGFDVTEVESMVTKKAKFGLFSIQERLESVGGHFEIKSKVGQGSKITMTAPLNYKKITDGA